MKQEQKQAVSMAPLTLWAPAGGVGLSTLAVAVALRVCERDEVERVALHVQDVARWPIVCGLLAAPDLNESDTLELEHDGSTLVLYGPAAPVDRWPATSPRVSVARGPGVGGCSVLVATNDYTRLRASVRGGVGCGSAHVCYEQSDRALSTVDVARVIDGPQVAIMPHDAIVARAADAGLLQSRMPGVLRVAADRVLEHAAPFGVVAS